MTATQLPAAPRSVTQPASRPADAGRGWAATAGVLAAVVATADLGVQLAAGIIPPLLVLGVLGLVGVALLRPRPTAGRWVLAAVSAVGLVAGARFALQPLSHPESPVDFLHAVTALPLRAVVLVAAIAALRGWGGAVATRRAALAGLAGLAVFSGVAATTAPGSATPTADDVVLQVSGAAFLDGDDLVVPAGGALVIDNADALRHTFTVTGTDVDVELPASRAVRHVVDLPVGTYDYVCDIPGHESMTGTLQVAEA